jgi:hypothetical protein
LSRACTGEQSVYYQAEIWVYCFLPLIQFPSIVSISSLGCVHGCGNHYTSHQYQYRPMFTWDKIVWLSHRRLCCGSCGKTVATIDLRVLKQLPTTLAERLDFSTTRRGAGIHLSMISAFSTFSTKGVMFGSFAKIINELHIIRHVKCRLSFLDALSDYKSSSLAQYSFDLQQQKQFSSFIGPGDFNRISLGKNIFRASALSFLRVHEPYMQAYQQTCIGDGVAADHTFNYSNKVKNN